MTDEGRKVPHPTPAQPAYYASLPMGNKIFGYSAFYQKDAPTEPQGRVILGTPELAK